MKKYTYLFLPLLLNACAQNSSSNFYDTFRVTKMSDPEPSVQVTPAPEHEEIDSYDLKNHNLNKIVQGLSFQMMDHSTFVDPTTPIAIASFVNLSDLESTSWLGNQIAESFMHEFQRHGLIVVDYKTTGFFRVSPEGDFVFSRNWKELPDKQIIDYVVAGTLVEQQDGYLINARMIGMLSHVVVASGQTFIPRWAIGEMPVKEKKNIETQAVVQKNKKTEQTWVSIIE